MMKRYIYISLMVIFSCSLIYSQDVKKTGGFARVQSMGVNPYIIDPFYQTVNPAWGATYDDFLFGDLGSSAGAFSPGGIGQYVSVNFSIGNNLTIGGILTRNNYNGLSIATLDPLTNFPGLGIVPGGGLSGGGVVSRLNGIVSGAVVPLDNNLELMGTLTIGRIAVGLGIAYASTSTETPAATGSSIGSASQLGVNIGIVTNLTNTMKLDLAASLMFPSASFEPAAVVPGNSNSEVSQTIIGINGRLFWKFSSKLWFVPIINFATASGSFENGTTTTPTTGDLSSVSLLTVGLGINYVVGDFLLAGGPSFSNISTTSPAGIGGAPPELTTSVFSFPVWNLGLEWNLLDWLVGRLGYIAATSKVSSEVVTNPGSPTPTIGEFITTAFPLPVSRGATVGIGFRFGDFSLDATVNEDVLRQGFNNIGGGSPTFAYLSASYAIP